MENFVIIFQLIRNTPTRDFIHRNILRGHAWMITRDIWNEHHQEIEYYRLAWK